MASLNKVFIIGNLTRDPELRYTPSGQAVSTLRFAVTHQWRSASGEQKKETSFIDVVVWARQAENCTKYLKKGSQAFVEGRLRIREYEARGEEGRKRYAMEIIANTVQFLDRPGGRGAAAEAGEQPAPASAPAGEAGGAGAEPVEEPFPNFEEEV